MWKKVRIFILLLILLVVAVQAWQDRSGATSWKSPLWVGLFPVPADDSPMTARWFAAHAATGPVSPRIRLFLLFHDPQRLASLPDSHGMQKGLVGVVEVFADRALAGSNDVVIAHELLHTLGATDKYVLGSGAPIFPQGFADPDAQPRYPQARTEIMAGRRPLSQNEFEMPASLRDVVVGPATAAEIRWTAH